MNIRGIELLKAKRLPEGLFIFRSLSEISEDFLSQFGDEKELFIIGVDNRNKITDNPYKISRCRVLFFSKSEMGESFNKLNLDMDTKDFPQEHRIFITGKIFDGNNLQVSGQVFKNGNFIFIDFMKGLRPSGKDWQPEFSYKIPIINGRCSFGGVGDDDNQELIKQLCKDALLFYEGNPYLDFAVWKNGDLIYHDCSLHNFD